MIRLLNEIEETTHSALLQDAWYEERLVPTALQLLVVQQYKF